MKIEFIKIYRSKVLFVLPFCFIAILLFTYYPYSKLAMVNQKDLLIQSKDAVGKKAALVADMKEKGFPQEVYSEIEQQEKHFRQRAEGIAENNLIK